MPTVGQIERKTQQRVVKLFREQLGYDYLDDWTDREGNANIEPELLRGWLARQGVEDTLITRALYILEKAAGDTSRSLYDRTRLAPPPAGIERRAAESRELELLTFEQVKVGNTCFRDSTTVIPLS